MGNCLVEVVVAVVGAGGVHMSVDESLLLFRSAAAHLFAYLGFLL